MTKPYQHIGAWLKRYTPTFCWQTYPEVLTFLEQINEDVKEDSVKMTLSALTKKGFLIAETYTREPNIGGAIHAHKYCRADK